MKIVQAFPALKPALLRLRQEMSAIKKNKHIVFDIDDTLLFDNGRSAPNMQIIEFLTEMKANGFQIHLITARGKSTEAMTKLELNRSSIPQDTLDLASEKDRASLVTTSEFKRRARAQQKPVAVTIGDQWGDMTVLKDETDIDTLDNQTCSNGYAGNPECQNTQTPWVLVTPEDDTSLWGLKLMANQA